VLQYIEENFSQIWIAQATKSRSLPIMGIKQSKKKNDQPSLKIQKRMKNVEKLPPAQQKVLLKTIDTFLKAAEK